MVDAGGIDPGVVAPQDTLPYEMLADSPLVPWRGYDDSRLTL